MQTSDNLIETWKLLIEVGAAQAGGQARMLVHAGGVTLNDKVVGPVMIKPVAGDVLKVGKRKTFIFE